MFYFSAAYSCSIDAISSQIPELPAEHSPGRTAAHGEVLLPSGDSE